MASLIAGVTVRRLAHRQNEPENLTAKARRRAAFLLGADGVEIDEPRLEERLRDGFERGAGVAQEGDVVVEGAQSFANQLLGTQ